MKRHLLSILMCGAAFLSLLTGCRDDDPIPTPEPGQVQDPAVPQPGEDGYVLHGFYLLNEGNMGTNKATLDYMDFATGVYTRNIYAAANPTQPMEMGDVGNDIAIYGSKLWAVINCSNKVEVMRASDAVRLGQIDIPNCRSIIFHKGYAYVTSYAGPVEINPDYRQKGFVAKIDTATLREVGRCTVGYQPDGLAVCGDKIYVANSGGYMVPNYENTLSVIDIATFTEVKRVPVAINLNQVLSDSHGNVWVSSRGDYYGVSSKLYCYDPKADAVTDSIDTPVSAMTLHGDSLYIISTAWSNVSMSDEASTAIVNTATRRQVSAGFVAPDVMALVKKPYGLSVNPVSGDIYITDAGNYVTPGWLYCLRPDGTQRWRQRTGDIPAHFAFYATIQK
ncbi:MAG: YncE family protein [Lepagella sp.]